MKSVNVPTPEANGGRNWLHAAMIECAVIRLPNLNLYGATRVCFAKLNHRPAREGATNACERGARPTHREFDGARCGYHDIRRRTRVQWRRALFRCNERKSSS